MRAALGIGLALLAIGYGACTWTGPRAAERAPPHDPWRRTIDGWERRDRWEVAEPHPALRLHPGVVAAGLLLTSLLALAVAAPSDEESG